MKKTPILLVCAAMMLSACSGATATIKDKDEAIMTIGNTTYTKGDEYDLLKISTGTDLTMELVKQAIYKQEVKVTKEMKETAPSPAESEQEAATGPCGRSSTENPPDWNSCHSCTGQCLSSV